MSGFRRREVLGAGLVSLADLVAGGPLSGSVREDTRREIFDAHLHIPADNGLNFQWNIVTATMPEFVAYLDRCGVRRGVISSALSNRAQGPEDYRTGNREVAKYVERYRGRFKGACVVTPFAIEEALREIEECRTKLGMVWLGEFCPYMTGYKYETPEWARIMKLAAELDCVVHVHATTKEVRYLTERFPENTLVLAHLGGSPDEIWERIALVAGQPKLYMDIAGSGQERVGILERAVKEIGADRVLYGSDFAINEPAGVIARVRNAFLTEEQREKILFRNLERLLDRGKKAGASGSTEPPPALGGV
jgi:predicted TIM-barrel fold metal-dependent hydrolase